MSDTVEKLTDEERKSLRLYQRRVISSLPSTLLHKVVKEYFRLYMVDVAAEDLVELLEMDDNYNDSGKSEEFASFFLLKDALRGHPLLKDYHGKRKFEDHSHLPE